MKTIKAIYYSMKQSEARSYFNYWRDKALACINNTEKWKACLDHMMYWLYKMLDYNIAIHKELES